MKQITCREAKKALRAAGWIEVRSKGSHHQFKDPKTNKVTVVPGDPGCPLSRNVIKSIERALGFSLRR